MTENFETKVLAPGKATKKINSQSIRKLLKETNLIDQSEVEFKVEYDHENRLIVWVHPNQIQNALVAACQVGYINAKELAPLNKIQLIK